MAGDLAKKLKLRKVDAEDNTKVLANAEFEVTKPDGSKFTLTTGADGTVTSGLLIPGKYKVRETKAPQGYLLDSTEYTVDIASDVGTILTVKDKLDATSVKVTKQWVGTPAASVEIKLFADGQDANKSLTLNAAGNWEGKFENLPKYKADGSEIVYTVRETPVAGYTTTIEGDTEHGYVVTNKANVTKKDKPKKPGSTPKAPKTGDLGNVDWYMFTAFASLQALIVLALLKRRKTNEK